MNPLGDIRLILCSASPRRRQLLQGLGLSVEITSVDIDETPAAETLTHQVAEEIAIRKADAWQGELTQNDVLITADTVVILGKSILGKPRNAAEAKQMLQALSGKTHQVITGVCLRSESETRAFSDTTEVRFKPLSEAEIDYYIEQNKPFDKAGSYGIQEYIGFIGVEHLSGSYYNVMGLPLNRIYEHLSAFNTTQ